MKKPVGPDFGGPDLKGPDKGPHKGPDFSLPGLEVSEEKKMWSPIRFY